LKFKSKIKKKSRNQLKKHKKKERTQLMQKVMMKKQIRIIERRNSIKIIIKKWTEVDQIVKRGSTTKNNKSREIQVTANQLKFKNSNIIKNQKKNQNQVLILLFTLHKSISNFYNISN